MNRAQWLVLGALVGSLVTGPSVYAQRAVHLSVHAGGFNGVTDLNDAGTANLKNVGYSVSGSVAVDLSRLLAVRVERAYARNEFQHHGMSGVDVDRSFWDAGLQLQYETNGLKPYIFAGAGVITLLPDCDDNTEKTKFAGNGGIGMTYIVPGSNFGILAQGKAWVYRFSGLSGDLSMFDKTQLEVAWSAGVSYRIPLPKAAAVAAR